MMQSFETIIILNKDYPHLTECIDKYKRMIQEWSDKVIVCEDKGVKRLAYEIKSHSEGYYVMFTWRGNKDEGCVDKLETELRTDDAVLKYLTVKITDEDAVLKFTEDYIPSEQNDHQVRKSPSITINALDVLFGKVKMEDVLLKKEVK